jgi:hypothetical protein
MRDDFPYRRAAPILLASPAGQLAYGLQGEVSYFTEGLLKCMRGVGAAPPPPKWRVTTDSIRPAIKLVMERVKQNGRAVGCSTDGPADLIGTIHELDGPPPVEARLQCAPDVAHALAELSARRLDGSRPPESRLPALDPWEVTLAAGAWEFEARFPLDSGWQSLREPALIVLPPFFEPDPFEAKKD